MTEAQQYQAKFQEMQKHIPFIQKVIEKLKVSNSQQGDNPRKAQLQKMEMLHELLTNPAKKLKMETLMKCEGVLVKLQAKIEKQSTFLQNEDPVLKPTETAKPKVTATNTTTITSQSTSASSAAQTSKAKPNIKTVATATVIVPIAKAVASAPASPSPERLVDEDDDVIQPVVIPTERRESPIELLDKQKTSGSLGGGSKLKDPKQRLQQHDHQRYRSPQQQQQHHHHSRDSPKLEEHRSRPQDVRERTSKHSESSDIKSSRPGYLTPPALHYYRQPTDASANCPAKELPPLPPPLRFNIHNPPPKVQPLVHKKETKTSPTPLSSKSSSPQILQTVKVVITEPLPANIAKQHFPPHHQYRYQQTQQQQSSPTRFLHNIDILPQSNMPTAAAEKSQDEADEAYNPDECWEKYNEAQKKPQSLQSSAKPVFSRLGDKVKDDEPKKSSAPINIPARSSTPIPEVLKSPPLSVSDIKNLLIESGGEQITSDISEIGTRRTKKPDMSDCKNSLDFVRRKFAQIAKINTSQMAETNCLSSPSSPAAKTEEKTLTTATTPKSTNKSAFNNERLALKYNPHPRQERLQSLSSNDGSECSLQSLTRVGASPNDPRLKLKIQTSPAVIAPLASNVNVLPSINNSDPRLKRQAAMNNNAIPVLCNALPQPPSAHLNPFGVRNDPRLSRQQSFQQSNTTNPYLQQSPIRRLSISQPPVTPEENWDSDSAVAPIEQSPIRNLNVSQPNITPEENWDSDPDDGPAKAATSFGSSREVQRPPADIPTATNRESICQPRDNDFHTDVPVLHSAANVRDKCWESRPEVVASILKEPVNAQIPGSLFVPFAIHAKPQPSPYPINPYVKRPAALLTTPAIPPLTAKTSHDALSVQPPFMPAVHASPPVSRFNSSLNDNTERMKYFEARQQKSQQPRTYKEFREAREEANRRAMDAKYKAERKKGYIDAAKRKFQEEIAKKEQEQEKAKSKIDDHLNKLEEKRTGVIKEKEAAAKGTTTAAAKAVAGESTLDKMYRTQNFNTQFPKATISFKIPKKKTEEPKPAKDLPPPKAEVKGTKQAPQKPLDKATKPSNVKESDKSQDKTDKNDKCKKHTTTIDKSAGQGKADKSSAAIPNTKSNEENNKKHTKEAEEEVEDMPQIPQEVIKTMTDKPQVNRRDPRCKNKDINEENESQTPKTSKEEEIKAVKTSKENLKDQKTDTKSIDNLDNKVLDKKSYTVDDIKPFEVKSGLTASSATTPEFKPQRILRRRCTMVAIGSAPLVDKDKLMKANALMLEDIEERDKLRRKKEEEERQNARRNKHLAEMFQKTDDNCSVSTQNIITGKRRTRASINFNETQNALKVFKHKAMPAAVAAAASPSSTATAVGSAKVSRARAKSNKACSEDSAAEKEDNEDDDVTEEETNNKMLSDTEESGTKSNKDRKKNDDEKNNTEVEDFLTPPDKATDDEEKPIVSKLKKEETTNRKPLLKKGLKKATGGAIVKIVVATNKQGQGTNKKANATAVESEATAAKAKAKSNNTSSKSSTLTTAAAAVEIEAAVNTSTKPLEEEHQNCAVSSTSTDLTPSEETPSTSSAAAQRLKEEVNDNEPTSTGSKSSNPTPTLPEDETSRHAFLNEFVQEIIKPNADKQHILSLLGQILSEDKLQFIKTVIDSTNKQEEEDKKAADDKAQAAKDNEKQQVPANNTNVNKKKQLKKTVKVEEESAGEEDEDEEQVDSDDDQKSSSSSLKHRRGKGGRKNELQRLNEDIRDMFICEGVLTATGKRMCTLMQTSDKSADETETSKEAGRKSLQSATPPQIKTDIEAADSAKKRLVGRNKTPKALPVRRSLRACKNAENLKTNSTNEDEGEVAHSNESKEDRDESTKNDSTPTRKMPVLKPHTPIKLPEELDIQTEASTDTEKPASSISVKRKSINKPCPKSKKVKTVVKNDDDKDLYTSSDSQTDSECDNADETATKSCELDTMKNTNVHWHNQSKYTTWCMLCSKKIPAVSCSFHYKMHHGENFISRLAPILLQKFKQGKLSQPLFGVDRSPRQASWFYRCPFCLQYFNTPMPLWLEHFQNHTAEFRYECSKCHWGSNRLATTRRHIGNVACKGATVVNSVVKLVVPSEIKAQVCHLCNFVQLKRANLERHYVEQHQLDIKNVDILGYTVTLFNCAGVELVTEAKAQAKEDEQRKLIEAEEKIIELEDEAEEEEEEGSTQLDETNKEEEVCTQLDNTKKVKDIEMCDSKENEVKDSTEAVKEKPNDIDDHKAKGIESSGSAESTEKRQGSKEDCSKTRPSIADTDKDANQMDPVGVHKDTDISAKPDKQTTEKSSEANKKTAKTSIAKQKTAENQLSSKQPDKSTNVTSKPDKAADKSLAVKKKIAKTTTDTQKSTEHQLSSPGPFKDTTDTTAKSDKATDKPVESNKKIANKTTEKQTDEKGINKSENKTSADITKKKDGKQAPPQSTCTKKDESCDEKLTENILPPLKKSLKEETSVTPKKKDGKQQPPQSTSTKEDESCEEKLTENVLPPLKKSLKEETSPRATVKSVAVKVTQSGKEGKPSTPRNTSAAAENQTEVQLQTGKDVKDQKVIKEKAQTTGGKPKQFQKEVATTPAKKSPVAAAVKQPEEILLQTDDNKPQNEKLKQLQKQQVKTTVAGKTSSEQDIKDTTNNKSQKEDNKPQDEKLKQPQQQVKTTTAKKVTSTAVQKILEEHKTVTTTPEEKDNQTAGQVEQTLNAAKAAAASKDNMETEMKLTKLEATASSQQDDQTEIQLPALEAEDKATIPEQTIYKIVKPTETELAQTTEVIAKTSIKETDVLQHPIDAKTISSAAEKLSNEATSTMAVKLTKPDVLAKSSTPQHKQATEEIDGAAQEKTTSTPKKKPASEITKQPSHELLPTERPIAKTTPKKKPSTEELNKSEKNVISPLKTDDNSKEISTVEDVKSPQGDKSHTAEAVTKKSAEEPTELAAIATPTKKPLRPQDSTKLENTPNKTDSKLPKLCSNEDQKQQNTTPKRPTPNKEITVSDNVDQKTTTPTSKLLVQSPDLEQQLLQTPQKKNVAELTTSESDTDKELTPLKFNAQKVVTTYARKRGNDTSPSTANTLPTSDDCVIIDEDINIRYLQDELLTLAAQAANEEEENEKQLKALDVMPESPKTIENFATSVEDSSPQANTKMSDLISNSIDMLYQRNKRKSHDATDATVDSTMHTKRACYHEPTTANAFMPSVLEGCESPPIQILAQSIVSIDSVEHNVEGVEIQKPQTSSIAERLSQRFKLLQEKAAKGLKDSSHATKATTASESANARYSELVKLTVGMEESATAAAADVAVLNETKEFNKPVIHEEITVISDDEDWEDIEITETAPITLPTNNQQKTNKSKGLFQKFGLFKGNSAKTKKNPTPLVFLPKKKIKDKTTATTTTSCSPVTTKSTTANIAAGDKSNSASPSSVHLGFKPVINIIEDLLPDSPCNDPIDLVPELTPLEPLTDLNDISSILDSNLSINIDESQTCIQDALDFISEQQAHDDEHQGVQNSQVKTKTHTNKIQHVGFSLQSSATNSVKFYCLLENCSFLFSSDSTGLENHFLCEHSRIKWNGYCVMCEAQCLPNDQEYSIVKEIKHMIECHVSKTTTVLETHSNESSQHSVNTNPPAEERPRIKLRRMTGDCLSTSNSESSTPSGSTTAATTVAATLATSTTSATVAAQSNTLLGALLNAKQKPPTKDMPPQPAMPLTEPLLIDAAANFSNMDNDFLITAVASGVQSPAPAPPMLISNVVSLNEKLGEPTVSTLPKISNVCTLNSRSVGNLWAQQIEQEKQDLLESAAASLEVSSILANAGQPSLRREATRAQDDSPGPVIVSETLPVAQAKTGDFVITQTVSAQYDTHASAAVGFNISIEVPPASNNSIHNANLAGGSTPTPATSQSRTNSPLISLPLIRSQSFAGNAAAHDEDSRNSLGFHSTSLSDSPVNAAAAGTSHITSRQYKCMASGCKFTSRVPVAMSDHLRFHERRSFSNNQDYLACAFCDYQADDVDDYMKHSDKYHIINKTNKPPQTATTSALPTLNEPEAVAGASTSVRGRICDILSKKMESSANRSVALAQQQEAQKAAAAAIPKETEEMYLKKLRATIEEIVGTTGFSDEKLYRCVIKNCTTPLTEATFHNHVMYHISTLGISNPNSYVYKCPHCTAQYHRPAGIKAHIKNHARNRYFCYMCDATSANPSQMMKHFSDNHWHTLNMYTKELLKAKDSSYYVTYSSELNDAEVHKYGEKLILEWQRKKSGSKTHFKSSEIDLLPIQPIFQRPVNCGECEYKTKVRTNMYRHLLMHKQFAQQPNNTLVASVDPVNPVPCLNSNERFFDKMTNLASSSLIPSSSTAANAAAAKSAFKLPHAFVLDEHRYRCGVPNCDFVNTSEVVFRVHMSTLHSSDAVFRCPFCQEEICKRGITMDRILNHLRFHGSILHRCEECNYVHHLRFVVERHINEKHPTMKVNIVKHERTDVVGEGTTAVTSFAGKKYKDTPDPNQSQATSNSTTNTQAGPKSSNSADSTTKSSQSASNNAKSKGKWQCDLCNHKVSSLAQIQQHCQNTHGQSKPYQCVHCSFGSQQLSQILYHIDENHAGKTREARYIYHKSFTSNEDNVADTRPLWQRNDPTRVRHIRGILMEDEEESEKYRKKMGLDKMVDDEEEEQVDTSNAPNASLSNLAKFLKGYEFGCFHCDHKTETLDELFAKHYKNAHCDSQDVAKPFMFRLLRRVCCPECRKFTGNFYELQLHLLNSHNVRNYYAADVSAAAENGGASQRLTCGYCDFHCLKTELLQKHFQSPKVQHSPLDVCIQNPQQIGDVLEIGTKQTFFQCTLCTDLLSSRVSMVNHAKQLHAQEEGFSFRELTNTLIYHCALCSYSSTNESVLLRHMIDHFGRFKRCHFCHETQISFEGYMQHCYAEHRDDIRRFRELYPYREIYKFLLQMFILFPNGLVISKKNLLCTQTYGGEKAITECYEDIYKISQQPPIPRLSIARLVARKSIEACHKPAADGSSEEAKFGNQPSPQPSTSAQAKKITKRRCTVALGQDDETGLSINPSADKLNSNTSSQKKRKPSLVVDHDSSSNQSSEFNVPLAHAMRIKKRRRTVATDPNEKSQPPYSPVSTPQPPPVFRDEADKKSKRPKTATDSVTTVDPQNIEYFSYYGIKPEPLDLSKIYTKVAIGGINTPLPIEKFRLFFNIDCKLKLTKCDVTNMPSYKQYKHIKKACPASHKLRFSSN